MTARRVVSGMRPTGGLHLGHLRGVLRNWRALQDAGDECFFFVADWHALTTEYAAPEQMRRHARDMVAAWVAAGIDPARAVLFRQSDVPAHAELFTLLSMICPLPWLSHLPSYKEQKSRRGLDTHGFLGYPLLQCADIMIYRADAVPVGEDQAPHIEFAREIARRFNRLYGASESFLQKRLAVAAKIGGEADKKIRAQQRDYAEKGDKEILQNALADADSLALDGAEKQTLRDDLRYGGDEILRPPQALLAPTPKLPGTDGRKMSKSYDNAVDMFDPPEIVDEKIRGMPTDPARIRKTDKGEPEKCPVWGMHKIFSNEETRQWAEAGCRGAEIGCVECKTRLAGFINAELSPILARRDETDGGAAEDILAAGAARARETAEETLRAVRVAMRISS
ncbi:MAG: tryptophan--tRNA ligase [Gammaproteobacteria bacterium]